MIDTDHVENRDNIELTSYIKEYTVGRVVSKASESVFGHIVGFGGRNAFDELLIRVAWETGHTTNIHPSNLKLY